MIVRAAGMEFLEPIIAAAMFFKSLIVYILQMSMQLAKMELS